MTCFIAGMALLVAAQSPAGADQSDREPSVRPIAWEVRFEYLTPRRIEVRADAGRPSQIYWYLVYTAVNTSSTTQRFFPVFELVTDDLRVISTDMGISPLVFDAIRERHRKTHPDLVHPTEAIGALRTGEGYARQSVAIWRSGELTENRFRIYVGGLSGEARVVPNPAYDADRPEEANEGSASINPRYFTLRKTLELRYVLPGSDRARLTAQPQLERSHWIMR